MKIISTDKAPGAIGPYSQAVEINGMVYTSGQLGMDPSTGELASGVEAQAELALKNGAEILKAAGLDFSNVVKTVVFIKNMDDFGRVNDVYSQYFPDNPPARSCVEVSRLPKDALVEMEFIAAFSD